MMLDFSKTVLIRGLGRCSFASSFSGSTYPVTLTAYLISAILSLPTFHEDIGEQLVAQKRAQAELIASAVAEAAEKSRGWPGSQRELAVLLVTIAWHETRFSLRIHDGHCRPYECDHGRARGLWQLHVHASLPRERWLTVAGLDPVSTLNGATEAATALIRSRHWCARQARGRDWVAPTLLAYAGRGCGGQLPDIDARVRTYRHLLALTARAGAA
jgi:hypothetical protein